MPIQEKPFTMNLIEIRYHAHCEGLFRSVILIPLLFPWGIFLFIKYGPGGRNRNTPELIDPALFFLGQLPEFPGCCFLNFAHNLPPWIMYFLCRCIIPICMVSDSSMLPDPSSTPGITCM